MTNYGYVAGGLGNKIFLKSTERYDDALDAWVIRAPLSLEKSYIASFSLKGKGYVNGGWTDHIKEIAVTEKFDDSINAWVIKAPSNTKRDSAAGFALNEMGYVAAGSLGNGTLFNIIEKYDPTLDRWTIKTSMGTARTGPAGFAVSGYGYITGGGILRTAKILDVTERYDDFADSWAIDAPLLTARVNVSAFCIGDYGYVAGGIAGTMPMLFPVNINERYDSKVKGWTVMWPMNQARAGPAEFALNDAGYVVGGHQAVMPPLNTTEKYDPVLDAWENKKYMNAARYGSGAFSSMVVSPTTGSIVCSTVPVDAEIFLDGVDQDAVTPARLTNVTPGSHIIGFKLPNYNDCSVGVVITAGYTATATCTMTPSTTAGSVLCTSTPAGAKVFLDGVDTAASTPITLAGVTLGSHLVEFRLSGYENCQVVVIVTAGITTEAACILIPVVATGSVSCTSTPAGAKVFLDGVDTTASTPITLAGVSPGGHLIEFRLPGYENCRVAIIVTARIATEAACILIPVGAATGSVSCTSTPSGAKVFLDGVDTTVFAPVTLTRVPTGSHIIEFRLSGYDNCMKTVNVLAEETATASCVLTPITTCEKFDITLNVPG